ncbi:MAG: VWA domain-containing protein [Thermoguttaceae bacterium]
MFVMQHTVPGWVERLLGVPATPGTGTVWTIEHIWSLPPWATVLMLAGAVAFVVAIYLREGRRVGRAYRLTLAAIRVTLVALAMAMIAQTTLVLKRTGLPHAAVLLDDSLSMTIADQDADRSRMAASERPTAAGQGKTRSDRWERLQAVVSAQDGRWLRGLTTSHQLAAWFLTGLRPVEGDAKRPMRLEGRSVDVTRVVAQVASAKPRGEATRLGDGIRMVLNELRSTAISAVIVLTDGINTDGATLRDAAETARRRGVPLYFVGLGSDRAVPDLKLSDLMADEVVFVEDVVHFECRLTAEGLEGRKVSIVLCEKGRPDVLAKVDVTAGPDGQPQRIRLPYRPTRTGQFEYVVEARLGDAALATGNHRQSRSVEVRKEKTRVLLVQAYPSFEFRYLRNMLQRDRTIRLSTVLQDADPEYAEQDASALKTFPTREELFAYDVVILGDANPALLGEAAIANLADFVSGPSKGGGLALVAGPRYMPSKYRETPLARLLPFSPRAETAPDAASGDSAGLTQPFVVRPTELGLASPAMQLGDTLAESERIWRGLAPLYWLMELPELRPGVRVLAEHPTRLGRDGKRSPVICLQYVGAGKVLFHATDETWRWRYQVGDAYFARYWVQTIRRLCRSRPGEAGGSAVLSADRREYAVGEPVRLRLRFADERLAPAEDNGATVVVERSGQQSQRVVLRRTAVRGTFEGQVDGLSAGGYHAWLERPSLAGQPVAADFAVVTPPGEFAQTRMDAVEMRLAAEQTGGQFYTCETADRLPQDLPPGWPTPVESLPPRPLWNGWPVVALFLGLLVVEWVLRNRGGMV